MKEMTQEQKEQCQAIIHTAATAAAGAGLSPIPVSDMVALIGIHSAMIISLGEVFNLEIDKSYDSYLYRFYFQEFINSEASIEP